MQIYTFASGSTGNCTLVEDRGTAVLIDAGISARRIVSALSGIGMRPEQLSGILITHEHNDHICGLNTFIKHYDVPIFAPRTVANHLCWSIAGVDDFINILKPGQEETIGNVRVVPFHTPHDTPESVGYRITGSSVFGFCTDCGHVTDEVLEGLRGSDAALIEANHDIGLLRNGPYPASLKRRILSDNGHLSNGSCGRLAAELFRSGTRSMILGHLSRENNRPPLALTSVLDALSSEGAETGSSVRVEVAPERDTLHLATGNLLPLC